MYLVIAEKPSVSQSLAKVLGAYKRENGYLEGSGYLVSWCLGHLAEYALPEAYDSRYEKWEFSDLPIVPDEWKLLVAKDKKEQFDNLKKLLNRTDVEYVVNACDAGREGELIFKRVYDLSGSHIPVKRLWISSMEDTAIQDGFANLRDGKEYQNLSAAAVCRAQADWLIGMNATRAFTTKYFKRLSVGRVQSPTLAMLVERQEKMDGFVKEAFYKVSLSDEGLTVTSENIKDETEAETLAALCNGKPGTVTKLEKNHRQSMPPKLYDLTTLQREANRMFGYTAQDTLQELQELYEAKLVTYPRTDSQYLTSDMEDTAVELIDDLSEVLPFLSGMDSERNVSRLIDNKKVSDHHALLPTKEAMGKNLSELSTKQKNIFLMICLRLAQAAAAPCKYDETNVTVRCEEKDFTAKGKLVTDSGYQAMASAFRELLRMEKQKNEDDSAVIPDNIFEGMTIPAMKAERSKHFTAPPKAYSEDTLLAAMEHAGQKEFDEDTEKKGLGTPATRASIIEKLVSSKYAVRKGKQILPTPDGVALIAVLPDYLKSAGMTAEWENKLLLMEQGQMDRRDFMDGITDMIDTMLADCKEIPEEELHRFYQREAIGTCPCCGKAVYEGKQSFYCSDKECPFTLWKEPRYLINMRKSIDKKMAAELMKKGYVRIKDLYSPKTGKTFEADLHMNVADGKVNFKLEFPQRKPEKGSKKK